MASSVNIALPAIQKEFSTGAVTLSWVGTAYLLAIAVFLLPWGKLSDIYGRKKIFNLGNILFALASLSITFVNSIDLLIILRILQGAGTAMGATTGMAIITSVFPPKERGYAIGVYVASVYAGSSIGPFAGGLITSYFSWRAIFFINGILWIIPILLTIKYLKNEWADAKGEKFDITGSLIYGVSITALVYGSSLLPSKEAFYIMVSGISGLILFIKHQMSVKNPVFQVRIFRENRVFTFSSMAALINYGATFAITFLLSLYLQYIKGMSPHMAGLIMVTQPVMQALFSPLFGKLSDRFEPGLLASTGMALTVAGLSMLVFIGTDTSQIFIIFILIILGIGFSLFSSPNMNAIMSSVDKEYYGIASGVVATMRVLGQLVSMAVTTVVFAIFIGQVRIEPQMYPLFLKSIKICFIIFSILCAGGIYFSWSRGNIYKTRKL
jgi:EmrB/QacA subfamily drug resistance transporter